VKNHQQARSEFRQRLLELKNESMPSIYTYDLTEVVLYEKLLELQEQILALREMIRIRPEQAGSGAQVPSRAA
jgi:hypothetical protein